MSIENFIMPIVTIFVGILGCVFPPKKINRFYGYRTKRSTQSIEAWHYAQKYFGKMCCYAGVISLAMTVIVSNMMSLNTEILLSVQMMFFIVAVVFTEISLKRYFP